MNKTDRDFIAEMVSDYKQEILDWHDIQDVVMAEYMKDNKKQDEILAEIEKEIY